MVDIFIVKTVFVLVVGYNEACEGICYYAIVTRQLACSKPVTFTNLYLWEIHLRSKLKGYRGLFYISIRCQCMKDRNVSWAYQVVQCSCDVDKKTLGW